MMLKFPVLTRSACLFSLFLLPSYGALVTYDNRPAFNAAAPGLPTETFAAGRVDAAVVIPCLSPLSSTSGSPCFPANGLLPGVVYSSTSGPLDLFGAGYPGLGNTSKVLGPNSFSDSFDLTFAQASAVGLDVFAGPTPGNVLISIFNPANTELGSFTIAAPFGGTFFGVISDTDLIGRINIDSLASPSGEVIGNVSFGVSSVPEPCSLALAGLALSGMALRQRRKQSLRTSTEQL